jgi:hypothetical protein
MCDVSWLCWSAYCVCGSSDWFLVI